MITNKIYKLTTPLEEPSPICIKHKKKKETLKYGFNIPPNQYLSIVTVALGLELRITYIYLYSLA